MDRQLAYLLTFLGGYALLILCCELLNRKAQVDSEYTRKAAHVISALSALSYPYIFTGRVYVLALCSVCFTALLTASLTRTLRSIDGVERRTGGSYLLALSVAVSYCVCVKSGNITLYMLPVSILAICDPLAGIIGKHTVSRTIINGKTVAGSLSFLLSSLVICMAYTNIVYNVCDWRLSVMVALTAILAELLAPCGLDNLTIPLSVIAILMLAECLCH
jgi:dolichol kinase